MNEPYPPATPYLQPPPRKGMGCFAKGCLVVLVVFMLLGVMLGGFGWYVFKGMRDYVSQQPVPVRTYPATDEQYNAVLAKLQPFGQALNDGHAATLQLTADELNILIAKLPESGGNGAGYATVLRSPLLAAALGDLAKLRGRAYLSFVNDQVVSEVSAPINENAGSNTWYFNGRIAMDASYSADEFNFVLRSVAPLKGEATGFISRFSKDENFLRGFSRGLTDSFNRSFNEALAKNSQGLAIKEKIRTIIVQDGQMIFTSAEAVSTSPAVPGETPAVGTP